MKERRKETKNEKKKYRKKKIKERKKQRKKQRSKERKKQSKKDEEAIAFGTTLEQNFAIGPEAGRKEKGGGHVRVDTTTIIANVCFCLFAFSCK